AKHEDGHDGGGGGLGMQQDDKKGDGDYCRFGIRGTGLEFTITHTAGAGSPGGGNYLSGVYCGRELLHDDNDGRRFLMDFFNTSLSYHHRQGPLLDELSTSSSSSSNSSASLQCNRAGIFLDMMIRQRVPLFYAHPAISSNITACMLQQQPTDEE
ncbi:hypothetical protein FOZ62_016875, partial [Perkinsus olseni]